MNPNYFKGSVNFISQTFFSIASHYVLYQYQSSGMPAGGETTKFGTAKFWMATSKSVKSTRMLLPE
jgi:hypothetical protein